MSDGEKKLEVAHQALAEAEARFVRQEAENQAAIKDAEETRKQLEQAHQEWMSALDAMEDLIFVHDKDFRILRCNRAYQKCAGLTFKQIIGQPYYEIFPKTGAPLKSCLQSLESKAATEEEILVGDTTYRSRSYTVMDEQGEHRYSVHTLENINESKKADERLRNSEHSLAEAQRIAHMGNWDLDLVHNVLTWSDEIYRIFEIDQERFEATYDGFLNTIHPDDLERVNDAYTESVRSKKPYEIEHRLLMKDGRIKYVQEKGETQYDNDGNPLKSVGTVHDITQRKLHELEMHKANRALKTLSAGNMALVRATNEEELLQTITSVIVDQGGYLLASVGYAEDDPGKSITPKAWSGYEGDHYWVESLSWADTEHGQLPIAKAIRSGMTQICHEVASDPAFKPWRESAAERGYVSNIAMPLSDNRRTFGALCIYSSSTHAFDDEEVQLLEELANDLAYGIISLRTRKEHEQQTTFLRQSLEQSIQTIAATVEARDPYTAGHQRRVAELATAIAEEFELPEDQINSIHLAAIIHDLGKIRIPSELLSKPSKLTDFEFMLIKEHPQAGYEILKDVKFPWPIANIILQHHERLDGTGYPQGLKGEQILLESRILAVADVVEAMSSHRPYRASLGVQPALDEISRGRGSIYDPAVVDTCLTLFAEKGFMFSKASQRQI